MWSELIKKGEETNRKCGKKSWNLTDRKEISFERERERESGRIPNQRNNK